MNKKALYIVITVLCATVAGLVAVISFGKGPFIVKKIKTVLTSPLKKTPKKTTKKDELDFAISSIEELDEPTSIESSEPNIEPQPPLPSPPKKQAKAQSQQRRVSPPVQEEPEEDLEVTPVEQQNIQQQPEEKIRAFEANMESLQKQAEEELSRMSPEEQAEVEKNIAAVQENIANTMERLEQMPPEERAAELQRMEEEKNAVMEQLKETNPQAYKFFKSMEEMGDAIEEEQTPQIQ